MLDIRQANLKDTLHLTLRITATEAVEPSVITTCINSLSQDYTNLDDHISQTSVHTNVGKSNQKAFEDDEQMPKIAADKSYKREII